MISIEQKRLKYDFGYYVDKKLHIPNSADKYIISDQHSACIKAVMDHAFTVIEAYRGFGKSELISMCFLLWRADMWNEDGIIFSASESLAMQKLDMIRTQVEFDNEQLAFMCSKGVEGYIWNRGEIWLIDKESPIIIQVRNPKTGFIEDKYSYRIKSKLYAKSISSTSRGLHVENIVCDDIVVEDNSNSYDLRQTTARQFRAATIPIRKKNSRIIVVGTPQNDEDLLSELIADKTWHSLIIPVYDENMNPVCPALHSKSWIEMQRKLQGEMAFQQEYMLKSMNEKNAIFKPEILNLAKNMDRGIVHIYDKLPNEIVLLGTDYSVVDDKRKAERNDTDYFALIAIAFNVETKKRKVLNAHIERGIGFSDQLTLTRLWIQKYNVDALCYESHSFLDVYRQQLTKEIGSFPMEDTGSKVGKFDLYGGIPSMLYGFERSLWDIPYRDEDSRLIMDTLLNQLRDLSKSKHDDLADATFRVDKVCQKYDTVANYDANFRVHGRAESQKKIDQKIISSVFGPSDKRKETPISGVSVRQPGSLIDRRTTIRI